MNGDRECYFSTSLDRQRHKNVRGKRVLCSGVARILFTESGREHKFNSFSADVDRSRHKGLSAVVDKSRHLGGQCCNVQ